MTLRALLPLALLALSACAAADAPPGRAAVNPASLPPMRSFEPGRAPRPTRTNADMARDILDLTFALESGREVPRLTRFEAPVSLRVTGPAPPTLERDLSRLLARLRAEAGIAISRVDADRPANVTVQVVPRDTLRGAVPAAACFVVPRTSSWAEFLANRRGGALDWTTLERRERVAVFIPGDVAPQEVRDCLHEELAQALGPLNDLYRLTDSVFNDDNFHTVLTGFDMLALRATYAPEMRSGMSREAAARALPGVLARLNPAGRGPASAPAPPTTRDWIAAVERALGPDGPGRARRRAAREATDIAVARGWDDTRLAFSLFALGRLSLERDPELSFGAFLRAAHIYARAPETRIHGAHVGLQIAAFALASGEPGSAAAIVDANTDAAVEAQNAALLSSLLSVKARALAARGREGEARRLGLEALGWGRYGDGPGPLPGDMGTGGRAATVSQQGKVDS